MSSFESIDNKSILSPSRGFLGSGYTHTLNPYSGCAYAGTVCGLFCYAQHDINITKHRPWRLYGAKKNAASAYRVDYDRLKRPRRGEPKPLKIYMSSVTDPYVPQEKSEGITRSVLLEMLERPPDVLVIQTHATLIERDIDIIDTLSKRCRLWVSITVETDMDELPPALPRHASLPSRRLEALALFRRRGIPTQATISPLLPLQEPDQLRPPPRPGMRPGDPRPLRNRRRVEEWATHEANRLRRTARGRRLLRMDAVGEAVGSSGRDGQRPWATSRAGEL